MKKVNKHAPYQHLSRSLPWDLWDDTSTDKEINDSISWLIENKFLSKDVESLDFNTKRRIVEVIKTRKQDYGSKQSPEFDEEFYKIQAHYLSGKHKEDQDKLFG